jgi:hypothetical protein
MLVNFHRAVNNRRTGILGVVLHNFFWVSLQIKDVIFVKS